MPTWHFIISICFCKVYILMMVMVLSLLFLSLCTICRNSVLKLFPRNGPSHSIKNLPNKNEQTKCFALCVLHVLRDCGLFSSKLQHLETATRWRLTFFPFYSSGMSFVYRKSDVVQRKRPFSQERSGSTENTTF